MGKSRTSLPQRIPKSQSRKKIEMKTKEEKRKEEGHIIKEASTLAIVRYLSQFILGIRGFIIASVLGPTLYGFWSILKTVIDFSPNTDLGSVKGMGREVPLNVGRNKQEKNLPIQKTAFSWQLLTTLLLAIIIFIISLTKKAGTYRTEIALLAIVILFTNTYLYLKEKLVAEKKVMRVSSLEISFALLNTLFGLGLVFFIQIKGLLIGMIISYTILFGANIRRKDLSLRFGIDVKVLKKLVKTGLPIMVLMLSFFLMQSIDKIIVFTLLGSAMTGYYGLAAFISLLINYIPHAMSTVLSPRMLQKYGRTNDKEQIHEYFTKPTMLLTNGMPVILGLIFINTPWIIKTLLPQYIPSIPIIQVLVLGLFFSSIIKIPTDIIILFNKQKTLMYVLIGALILGGITDVIVIKAGYGIMGVAIATATIVFFISIIANGYCLRLLEMRKQARVLWKTYSPYLYSLIVLALTLLLLRDVKEEALGIIAMSALYIGGCAPLVTRVIKEGSLIRGIGILKNNLIKK
jgi:O-antigen/teichoic acid export membrane protein